MSTHPPIASILKGRLKKDMLAYINQYPQAVDELIALSFSTSDTFAWRAAWLLSHCLTKNDARMRPYLDQLIDLLPMPGDGHNRDLLNIVQLYDWKEHQIGPLYDKCQQMWSRINSIPSLRYKAFRIMVRIAQQHPELKAEILLLSEEHYLQSLSPGIRHSVLKALNGLD